MNNHWRSRVSRLECLEEFQSAHAGAGQIGEDQIHVMMLGEFQRPFARLCLHNSATKSVGQQFHQALAGTLFVINDQNQWLWTDCRWRVPIFFLAHHAPSIRAGMNPRIHPEPRGMPPFPPVLGMGYASEHGVSKGGVGGVRHPFELRGRLFAKGPIATYASDTREKYGARSFAGTPNCHFRPSTPQSGPKSGEPGGIPVAFSGVGGYLDTPSKLRKRPVGF
jgi:hypothetical protein